MSVIDHEPTVSPTAASSPGDPSTAEHRPSRAKTIIGWTIVAALVLIVALVGLRVAATAPGARGALDPEARDDAGALALAEILRDQGVDIEVHRSRSQARAAIDAWGWPGNVRELENRVKRAVIMADAKLVTAADLDLAAPDAEAQPINLRAAREATDRTVIRHALARAEGNISNTAKLLGISRPTLYDLLKSYDLHA